MGSRRKGRILAFQALYSWEVNPEQINLLMFPWLEEERLKNIDEETLIFARLLVQGTLENIDVIDATIKKHLDHWDITRLNRVDLAVLRLGTFSLLFQRDVPVSVTINEAISIVKVYGSDESFKFINGVLDSIHKRTCENA